MRFGALLMGFILLFGRVAVAQLPLPIPGVPGATDAQVVGELQKRPRTWQFMQSDVRSLIASRKGMFLKNQARLKAGNSVQALGLGREDRKYYHGAETGEITVNTKNDTVKIGTDFAQCLRYEASGLCMRVRNLKPEYRTLVDYNFPVAKVETVEQPFESGYLPRALHEGKLMEASHKLYQSSKLDQLRVTWGLGRAEMARNVLATRLGFNFGTSVGGGSGDGALGQKLGLELAKISPERVAQKSTFLDANHRWSTRPQAHPGARNVEFHIMPELAYMLVAQAADTFCHKVIYSLWQSEYPQGLVISRLPALSFFYWPREMAMLLRDPTLCSSFNAGRGKTPADMFRGLFNPSKDAPGGGGLKVPGVDVSSSLGIFAKPVLNPCQATNAGPWLPATNEAQSNHWTDASRVGVVRALYSADALMNGTLGLLGLNPLAYTYQPDRGDKFSWVQSDRMPAGCKKIEQWKLNEKPGANASLKPGLDPWHVTVFWPRFTCCMEWRGENPDFVTSRYGSGWCTVPGSCKKILRLY